MKRKRIIYQLAKNLLILKDNYQKLLINNGKIFLSQSILQLKKEKKINILQFQIL